MPGGNYGEEGGEVGLARGVRAAGFLGSGAGEVEKGAERRRKQAAREPSGWHAGRPTPVLAPPCRAGAGLERRRG